MSLDSSGWPVVTPPEGIVVNYINPPSRGREGIIVSSVTLALATAAVLSRLWVRLGITKHLGWDDSRLSATCAKVYELTRAVTVVIALAWAIATVAGIIAGTLIFMD